MHYFQDHEPPSNLVMKKGGWTIGEENATVLVNKAGEEEATRLSKKEKAITGSIRKARAAHMYSQNGALEGDEKNCAIM